MDLPLSSSTSIRVSLGKIEYQISDKGNFSFLRDDLIFKIQDIEGNEISRAGVHIRLILEKGVWDLHLELRFILNDEERDNIRIMIDIDEDIWWKANVIETREEPLLVLVIYRIFKDEANEEKGERARMICSNIQSQRHKQCPISVYKLAFENQDINVREIKPKNRRIMLPTKLVT
ncbi:uncharacterized protein LOC133309100 isoform X3 [Gastrolobium bilobum]|uniref:uncharacterized protein LOC133309100 isoform X3 n=1 Tax=Gastrolobium bilobum TaxID=150636 RepID=UPI002AAF129B|nr:uncharacterized protein LOC133309100 isoform X3 [Gastrolobium bilobum]